MLHPQIQISQKDCDQLIIKDITPLYSPENPGGYGGPNIEAENIIWTEVTLRFGVDNSYVIGNDFNATKGDWIISANEIPALPLVSNSECSHCGTAPMRMENGYLTGFPGGCVTVKYDVYSADSAEPLGRKWEGNKVVQYISICQVEKRLISLADKLTMPGCDGFIPGQSDDQRREMMNYVGLAWMKLDLITKNAGCGCDCVASNIKLVERYLDEVKIWT